ncbi:class I histocompatibility antigen, F10 alpha chain-like isoform X3 [Simochromis diagramma]|uniref:class I histocompatibility antigen, F10 alpha chain-like isoform X3 n=1 Tax=Simochromis diagramma TaxID=43689 RepID=UPI001A7F011A|nr:class I histocompatibility antigen, F10 alpha chain-like isoform X3 [Simochromis diagramma]
MFAISNLQRVFEQQKKMKTFLALSVIFLGLSSAAAVTHSLQYFYTASSGISSFPELLTVGMVDGQPFSYYDSKIGKEIPKQDWMAKAEAPEYWAIQTQASINAEQVLKVSIDIMKKRFNQTGGVHIVQRMYGCEWDDVTNEVDGYEQFGYDGEDFIIFDLQTETWVAPKQQGVVTIHKWNSNKAFLTSVKKYYTQICPEWLKKYLNYGRSSLMRTVLPSVSLLQKSSSSAISCHATGFYPNRAEMMWRKDGEETHEGVEIGEILTNNDGTFQLSVHLDLRSVPAEDWKKYDCVFQLSGVNKDIITTLDKTAIKTNKEPNIMIIPIVTAALVLAVIAIIGVIIYKKKTAKASKPYPITPPEKYSERKRSPSDSESSTSSDGSSTDSINSSTQLIPE